MKRDGGLDWRRRAGPAALVAAVLLWFGPLLGGGETLALRDTLLDFLPWREYAAQALGDGALPLWSHESRFGQPFLAHPQSAVFYPPHLLWLVLPSVNALVVTQAGHLLLLALGTYALARRLELSAAPAVVAAAGVAFSTYTSAQMEFLSAFETVCWAPLTLLLADRVALRASEPGRRLCDVGRPLAALAAAWAVQALAGHPQALFQNVTLVALFCGVRVGWGRALARAFAALFAAGLLGIALAAPQIFTSLAHLGESTRAVSISSGAAEASVHPRHLLSLIAPFAFGRPGYDGSWWNDHVYEFWAAACHVGIVPLLLAPIALVRGGRQRLVAAFGAIALVGLVLALGRHAGVYTLLADHVPPFDRFRWPGKWLHLVAFALPFLAALGLQSLLDEGGDRAVRVALALGGLLLVFVGAAYVAGDAGFYGGLLGGSFEGAGRLAAVSREHLRALVTLVVVLGALALFLRPRWRPAAAVVLAGLALADAGTQSRSLHGTVPSEVTEHVPEWVEGVRASPPMRVHSTHAQSGLWLYGQSGAPWHVLARDASVGETLLPLGVDRTWGFGQLIPRRQWDAWERLQDPGLSSFERERITDLLNIGLVVAGEPFDEAAIRSGRLPRTRLVPRTSHLPRAFVVGTSVVENDDPWSRLMAPDFDPRRAAVFSDAHPLKSATDWPHVESSVTVEHGWNRIDVRVRGEGRGHLVVLEPYDARWTWTTTRVDGERVAGGEPRRTNGLFMSVYSEPGAFTHTFRYREPALYVGAAVSGLGLIVLLLLALRSPRD